MKQNCLKHFHAIVMHSVEEKDRKSPVAVQGSKPWKCSTLPEMVSDSAICTVANSPNSIVRSALEEKLRFFQYSEFLSAQFTFCLGTLLFLEIHRGTELHRGSHHCTWAQSWVSLFTYAHDHRVQLSIQLIRNVHSKVVLVCLFVSIINRLLGNVL